MSENPKFSPIIAGVMRWGQWGEKFSTSQYETMIDQCIELGIKDFDHADIYGDYTTEEHFGEALKQRKDLRSKIQITTKCGIKFPNENRPGYKTKYYDLSTEHINKSVDRSLKNFHTDYLDVLLLHRPDYLMNPAEIAEVFASLKKSGKVRYFGVSNFTVSQLELLHSYFPLVNHQLEVSVTHLDAFEDGSLDTFLKHNIKPTSWSPLGGGKIFGTGDLGQRANLEPVYSRLCDKYDCSLDRLLLAWLLSHPSGIIPVLGTSKILRLATALESYQIKLHRSDWYDLFQASTGIEIP